MQVGQQVVNLFIVEHVSKAIHFVSSHANDVPGAVIVRWHATGGKIFSFEDIFQTRASAFP